MAFYEPKPKILPVFHEFQFKHNYLMKTFDRHLLKITSKGDQKSSTTTV